MPHSPPNRPSNPASPPPLIAEQQRLEEDARRQEHWKRWGPYLSERAWGTVREDYSPHGTAWESFPHDHARSRAYRWNEDGLAGISDRHQYICFAIALWNGRDPILKERVFGLTGNEGNHGEDVKEYYFYLDSTPTHSYMKYLYKYPQAEFPYAKLVEENRRRGRRDPEYELIDTGVFDENRYFDVFVEYAKATPEDLCIRIQVVNRGPDPAELTLLPTLWFRNTWSWGLDARRPRMREGAAAEGHERHRAGPRVLWPTPPLVRAPADAAVHGERDKHQPALWRYGGSPVCERQLSRLCGAGRQRSGEPRQDRLESRRPLHPLTGSRRIGHHPSSLDERGERARVSRTRPSTPRSRNGFRKPTSSMTASRRSRSLRRCAPRAAAGLCRPPLEQAVLPL